MRALRLEEFNHLAVVDLETPVPAEGEVLIRIVATGICGSDVHGFTGENGRRIPGQVMGHESVGTVEALGSAVDPALFTVGEAVTFNPVVIPADQAEEFAGREQHSPEKYVIGVRTDIVSSFAQFISVPARNVVVLPAGMPIEHGALVEPLAVAVHAVARSGATAGQSVFVAGGGPIGQSVVLALAMAGIDRIIVSEVDAERRALLERLGATTFDPRSIPAKEATLEALGSLADVAIDAVGVSPTLADCLKATRLDATICLVGMGAKELYVDAFLISTEERTLVGSFTYSAADFRRAAGWIARKPEIAAELISAQVGLDEAQAAFVSLATGKGTPGKILVRLDR